MSADDLTGRVDAALAALDEDALVRLAMELTDVASPTGHEEDVARCLHDRMQAEGLVARLQPIEAGRCNVLGTHEGSGRGRTLMFNAHLDTHPVPGEGDAQRPAAIVRNADGEWIAGSGITNMKGVLAAYVAAVAAVRQAGVELAGDVLIAGVAGGYQASPVDGFQGAPYRGFGVGTQHLLAQGGVADMCVLGDPTAFKLVRRFFGTTHARIDVRGTWTPSDHNAVEQAAEIVSALRDWIPDYKRRNTVEGVEPSVDVLAIEGGWPWTTDRRPASCSVFVGVGTAPDALPIAVKDELRQLLKRVRGAHPELDARVELYATNAGTSLPADSLVVEALHAAHAHVVGEPLEVEVVPWFCDAAHLNRYGIPTVNYGPGHPWMTGGRDQLRISELVTCTRVYIDLIVRVCGA